MFKKTVRFWGIVGSLFSATTLLAGSSHAAYTTFLCPSLNTVQLIITSPTGQPRIAAQCSSSSAGISWFSFRTSDGADSTKMLLSTLTAAKAAGRPVLFAYESTDTSGNAWGCASADCRIIKKIEMN